MKIITWNVNSVHARLPRVTVLLARHRPDVACLQEIKTSSGAFPAGDRPGPGHRPGIWGGLDGEERARERRRRARRPDAA